MNEDDVLTLALPRGFANVIDSVLRAQAGANDWCDHCWHGDHLPCDLWGRDGCRCPHHDEERA